MDDDDDGWCKESIFHPQAVHVHSRAGARFWLGCLLFCIFLAVVTFPLF
jgi:hypothetical protein